MLEAAGTVFLLMRATLFFFFLIMLLTRLLCLQPFVIPLVFFRVNIYIYIYIYKNIYIYFFFCLKVLVFGYMSGLGTEYFRRLLQSNCGVSVLDFTPRADGGSPHVCLNRLNQAS